MSHTLATLPRTSDFGNRTAITHFKLSHFRNLAILNLTIPPEASLIALIGPNGSGKTSVLEAISLLTPTRGLLGADGKSQIQQGSKEWGLWAQLESGAEIGQVYRKAERVLHIDGHKATQTSLTSHGSIVWLTPATDFLFSGPPANRRRWLDDLTVSLVPAHAQATQRYRQHRQSRLKLLTSGQTGDWLDAEERLAAEWGIAVLKNRLAYLQALGPHMPGLALALQGNALEILGEPDPITALKGKFERSRDIDARLQRTHAGPNTLDLTGTLTLEDGREVPLSQASSGQHKRGLILWLVGHVQLLKTASGRPPLVLIDEFSAHLDAPRRQLLLHTLQSAGCQIWLTDIETPATTSPLHLIKLPQS